MAVTAKEQEIAALAMQLEAKDRQLLDQESSLSEKDHALSSLQRRCSSLKSQLESAQRKIQTMEVGTGGVLLVSGSNPSCELLYEQQDNVMNIRNTQ